MVIDSHTLLWWLEGGVMLSKRAKDLMNEVGTGSHVFRVSAVTFWEIRRKEVRGILEPKTSVCKWPELMAPLPNLKVEDVSTDIWLRTAEMEWEHRDPADRIIAATALGLGVPVLTKDRRFHAVDSPVEAVW